jgi:hypothetical protein
VGIKPKDDRLVSVEIELNLVNYDGVPWAPGIAACSISYKNRMDFFKQSSLDPKDFQNSLISHL